MRDDCYYKGEYEDMGARFDTCTIYEHTIVKAECDGCKKYIPSTIRLVKKGKWLDKEPAMLGLMYATCSRCDTRQTLETRAKYCPLCGSIME